MLHVLVVEDNSADALVVREAIGTIAPEADVMIASDGEQALRFLVEFKFKPDIIFLDLNVPKLDGLQILECSGANEDSLVIVLTGSINPSDNIRALELGAREYILKPLDLDSFLNAVSEALERWAGNATRRGI
jgi:DNA-binding response OmpR family regulator